MVVLLRTIPETLDFIPGEMESSWGFEQSEGLTFRSSLTRAFCQEQTLRSGGQGRSRGPFQGERDGSGYFEGEPTAFAF